MGEEESHAEVGGVPVVVILIFSGFILLICGLGCGSFYCIGKCQQQHQKAKDEAKEKQQANAPVAQPPMVYQNQRKCSQSGELKYFSYCLMFQTMPECSWTVQL